MKEENKGTPQNKWSRIYRKRWFFPAVYLVVAALLLTAVIWFQNVGNQMPGLVRKEIHILQIYMTKMHNR
ncbi:hypothetical protein [Paracerasibacillus soli]|uniref:Uncharacterized protein n=1 Tax=Paracerasibacillus soli TaxID=480284 RepID=A0ABU5CSW5_9BACI|nr:hypothetical protein [Virgibacillus soli]MDY0409474.1 hypothetical protein [Virgibacillus soli]